MLHGLGGCGKTSLALEYMHRHLDDFGIVWQFPAEEPTALAAGHGALASQIGARGPLGEGNPVAQVHAALATHHGRWLLLFDNAPSLSAIESVLPPMGSGVVLVTSQDPTWPGCRTLEIPMLTKHTAAEFLRSRTGDDDRGSALELAAELGGLPLALEQAAAYMQASGRSIAGYLDLFRRMRSGLLNRGNPTGYDKRVASTWRLAFDRLQQDSPQAVALLRLLACCASEHIPVRLLLQQGMVSGSLPPELRSLLNNPLEADDALAALRRYSLISPLHEEETVSVHRLVQAVTLDSLPSSDADTWKMAARAVISDALPQDPALPGAWPAYSVLLPHAEAALSLTDNGMLQLAEFLGASGNYPAARDLSLRIIGATDETLGADHPNALSARASLAHWSGEAGDAATARDQFVALLPIRERVSGPEHPHTLTDRANLARWTGVAGDVGAARDQFAALLPIRERVSGPEHPHTITIRANLAHWTGEAGDAAAARDQYAALLPIREHVSGPEDPHTITIRANVSYWTGVAGDPAAARDQCAAVLPVRERVSGSEHPRTLIDRANLARWTGEAGDAAAARDQYAALLPIWERVLGPDHPRTLAARDRLAYWTRQASK